MNEQDTAFFCSEEAKRIQELWEPKYGDMTWNQNLRRCLILYPAAGEYVRIWSDLTVDQQVHKQHLVWLPRQGQLQEMLEERGYNWSVEYDEGELGDKQHRALAWKPWYRTEKTEPAQESIEATPSIALGKCLLEVLKEE